MARCPASLYVIRVVAANNLLVLVYLAETICNIGTLAKLKAHKTALKEEMKAIEKALKEKDLSKADKESIKATLKKFHKNVK